MSGDVQPRKRKDKKKKKDDDDITHSAPAPTPTPAATGVKNSAMGPGDVHMHVQSDHGTGGHWCAKIVFFALLAILAGLVALIIMENRGLSDVDTPLSESRFSEYFEGWVDEKRESHDEHDILESLNELDDSHEHDNEPFAEEEDHGTDEEHDDDEDEEAADDHDDANDDEDNDDDEEQQIDNNEAATEADDDDDDNNETEEVLEDTAEEVDNNEDDDDDDDDVVVEEPVVKSTASDNFQSVNDDEDDEDDEDDDLVTAEANDAADDDDDDDVPIVDNTVVNFDDDLPFEEPDHNPNLKVLKESTNAKSPSSEDKILKNLASETKESDKNFVNEAQGDSIKANAKENDVNSRQKNGEMNQKTTDTAEETVKTVHEDSLTPEELQRQVDELVAKYNVIAELTDKPKVLNETTVLEDDDDDDEFEKLIDNDDGEDILLQKLSEKNNVDKEETESPKEESSIAVKIVVGLAIVIVAPIVLVKKSQSKRYSQDADNDSSANKSATQCTDDYENDLINKRRFTLISADDNIPVFDDYDDDEQVAALHDEIDEIILDQEMQELYSDEEEYSDEEMDYDDQDNLIYDQRMIPQSFEELNAMYRSKVVPDREEPAVIEEVEIITVVEKQYVPLPPVPAPAPPTKPSTAAVAIEPPAVKESFAQIATAAPESHPTEPEEYEDEEIEYEDEEHEDEYEDEEEEEEDDLEDEEEYEVEEAELSDVDDYDLMKRLEEKYGKIKDTKRLSDEEEDDPSWTKIQPPKPQGSQSYKDEYDEELQRADNILRSNPKSALKLFESYIKKNPNSLMALYGKARALDKLSEIHKSNQLLDEAIGDYVKVIKSGGAQLNDTLFKEVAEHCIVRMRFKGMNLAAVDVHKELIERFPDDPHYRNQLALTYLLVNGLSDAKLVLHETLLRWRNDGFALVHYGFVIKNLDLDFEQAVGFLSEGIESKAEGTQDGRFYLSLGDALQRLGRKDEALQVYRNAAEIKLFPSPYQRSQYNVKGLKAQPYWTVAETTYQKNLIKISNHWSHIRDEGLKLLNLQGYFQDESENLTDMGDWKQFELFARGHKLKNNCLKAPLTCKLIEEFVAANKCKRGQVKFSVMHPGTHVWPHCGPSNCRIRAHLGLKVPDSTYIRVAEETKTWKEGKWLIFDDSFEHEVWHNGTEPRLILIVDMWHPDLTEAQKESMHAI